MWIEKANIRNLDNISARQKQEKYRARSVSQKEKVNHLKSFKLALKLLLVFLNADYRRGEMCFSRFMASKTYIIKQGKMNYLNIQFDKLRKPTMKSVGKKIIDNS